MECKLITLPQNKKESSLQINNLEKALVALFIKGLKPSMGIQE